jgi:hypothetical protein
MKRRARVNSIEIDLAELNAIHQSIRQVRLETADFASTEHRQRCELEDAEEASRTRLYKGFERRHKDLVQLKLRSDQAAKPPPMVAMLGELFLKSKERIDELRAAQEVLRRTQKIQAIAKYKRQQHVRLRHARDAQLSVEVATREKLADERHRRRDALDISEALLHDSRSLSACAIREQNQIMRRKREEVREAELARLRQHVAEERKHSSSPSLFLQLPPLFARSGRSSASDAQMASKLRREEGLRATPHLGSDDDQPY